MSELKALKESTKTTYQFDKPNPELLDVFDNPSAVLEYDRITAGKPPKKLGLAIHIEVPEFTCLCPITGQPDFGTIIIDYEPNNLCVESKSLKLYLMGFRNHGGFHEATVADIAAALLDKLEPHFLRVEGKFNPRGGIPFHPVVEYFSGM